MPADLNGDDVPRDPSRLVPKDEQIAALREQLAERERALARLADDARAALRESTYARLEDEHALMRSALDAVMRGTAGKPRLAHLHSVAENAMPKEQTHA